MSDTPRTDAEFKLEAFFDGAGIVETVLVEFAEQLETELADKNRQLSREIALRKTAEAEVAEFRASSDWYEKFCIERDSHLATQSMLADTKEQLAEARAEILRIKHCENAASDMLAAREVLIEQQRAEIERLKAPASTENLDERMKAAGMFTVAEMLAGTPLDKFFAHVGVVDMKRFEEWLLMRREEFLKMQASMEFDELKKNDLYEWVLAHAAVLAEVLANFRQARPDIERKDKLIEQMREALRLALPEARSTHCEQTILAALAAERGE